MGLETATYISELDPLNPTGLDPVSEGDNHVRLLKAVLQSQFPNLGAAAANMTAAELNILVGLLVSTGELNLLQGLTAAAAELNILDGALLDTAELNILNGALISTGELNALTGISSNVQTQLDNREVLYPNAISGHVRSAPVQIHNGTEGNTLYPGKLITTFLTESTYQTLGPTGSTPTPDEIWTALDNIPDEATCIIAQLDITAFSASVGDTLNVDAAIQGVTPGGSGHARVFDQRINSSETTQFFHTGAVFLPLNPSNKQLQMRWGRIGTATWTCSVNYKGFIYNRV